MAKRVDPLKAKQAKQKKIAIGLSVLFVAVLAYQVPKMLKLMKGPSAAAQTAAEPPDPAAAASATPAATSTATPVAPGAAAPAASAPVPGEAQPAVLVDSDLPVVGGEGQLLSFEQFAAKDPFDQQVDSDAVAGAASAADGAAGAGNETIPTGSAPTGFDAAAIAGALAGAGAGGTSTGSGGTSTGSGAAGPGTPSGGSTPAAPAAATATTISLNNELVDFAGDGSFPAAEPVFVLVSTAADGKSVEIGIAGGAYADGDKTITLKLGVPLTLQNTADGSRFELELLTVAGFPPPTSKG